MSGIARLIELNLVAVFSERTHKIRIDHLLANRDITLRTGHSSIRVYFSKFSVSSNLFILSFTYSEVSDFRIRNVLRGNELIAKFAL